MDKKNRTDPTVDDGERNGSLRTKRNTEVKNLDFIQLDFKYLCNLGVSLNGGTPKTPQNDRF